MSLEESVLTDDIFKFCTPSSERKWTHVTISFGIGVIIAVILEILVPKIKRSVVSLKIILKICTPLMILLGTFSHCYEVSQNFGALMNCAPFMPRQISVYGIAKCVTFAVHIYFLVRTVIICTVTLNVEWPNTIINVALCIQDILAVCQNQQILAFQFLFIYNYYCPEARAFLTRMVNLLIPSYRIPTKLVAQLCSIVYILGGCLRAAEEWDTNEFVHQDFEGSVTPMKTSLVYSYWILITFSTVGFGDLTPTTTAGRCVIMASIPIFVVWFSTTVVNLHNQLRQTPPLVHKTAFLFVVGCRDERQLINFLTSFKKKPKNMKVYVDGKDTTFAAFVRREGLDVIEASTKKESLLLTVCPEHAKETVFFLRDPMLDADEADKCNLDLVRSVRGYRCKSVLIVEMAKQEHQQLIQYVSGWNNTGRDICISQENFAAHMLALSAHSRLAPGIVGATFGKHLFTDNNIGLNLSNDFFKAVEYSYTHNGNLLLGAIGENNEILISPKQTQSNWPYILLATENHLKDFPTREEHHKHGHQRTEIKTRPIDSSVSVVETVSVALTHALTSHPITQTYHLGANVVIYESKVRPENDPKSILEFLDAKLPSPDTRLVSTMEHGYEACLFGNDMCVCGTYQIQSLLMCLLATAYHDHHLYKLWEKLIEEDLLEVEEIMESCTYKDLFHHLISHQKVPLGVETVQMRGGMSLRLPILNPESTLQLKKKDTVLFIRKN